MYNHAGDTDAPALNANAMRRGWTEIPEILTAENTLNCVFEFGFKAHDEETDGVIYEDDEPLVWIQGYFQHKGRHWHRDECARPPRHVKTLLSATRHTGSPAISLGRHDFEHNLPCVGTLNPTATKERPSLSAMPGRHACLDLLLSSKLRRLFLRF